MPQDAFTLKFLCEELNEILANGKVNKIVQTNNDSVVLTIWTGKKTEKLLLDVNPASPRICLIDKEENAPLTAPNFCMLLRKHLLSATLNKISIIDFDRIVQIDFTASSEFFDAGIKTLYVELMGRYSNIILTENGVVLGGNRGINFFDNGVRPLIVGLKYNFPPVNNKKIPSDKSLIEDFNNFSIEGNEKDELIKRLSEHLALSVQGLSLSTAEEIVFNFIKEKNNAIIINQNQIKINGEYLFGFINDFILNTTKNPCIYRRNGEIKDVCVYPYKTFSGEVEFFENLYKAEEYFYSQKNKVKQFKTLKDRLRNIILTAEKKIKKRILAIDNRINDTIDLEENKIKGEIILANIYKIKSGDTKLTAENYYNNSIIEITLNVNLTPSENAEKYYKKYNKQKRSLVALKPQKESAEKELSYIKSVLDEIVLAENIDDLNSIKDEMIETGFINSQKIGDKSNNNRKNNVKTNRLEKEISCRVYMINGYTIKVGKNNVANDKLTFSAKPNDIWLHSKLEHSSHVIISCSQKEVDLNTIKIASEICAYYSKARESGKTEVVWTYKKHVKKPSGAKLGFVNYTNFNSIIVEPNKHANYQVLD